jgi:hypothetical protein
MSIPDTRYKQPTHYDIPKECACCGYPLIGTERRSSQLITDDDWIECICGNGWCDDCQKCFDSCTCVELEDLEDAAREWMRRPKHQQEMFP